MKTMILAVLTVLCLGAGVANAETRPHNWNSHDWNSAVPGSYTGSTTAGD